jgi:hypothetical protein
MPEDTRRALSAVKVSADGSVTEIRFGKMPALDLLARICGLVQSGTNVNLVHVQQHAASVFLESLKTGLHGINCRCCEGSENYKGPPKPLAR